MELWRSTRVADVNHPEIQKKLLTKRDLAFSEARAICEQSNNVSDSTTKHSVSHFQRTQSQPSGNLSRRTQKPPVNKIPGQETKPVNRYFSWDELHLRSTCRFRTNFCHSCGILKQIAQLDWWKFVDSLSADNSASYTSTVGTWSIE